MFTIDTSSDFGKRIARQLDDEKVLWLTTVAKSGTPAPKPVWYLWHDGQILVNSQPGDVGVLTGDAVIDDNGLTREELTAYNAKYTDDIARLGMTPDQFHASYSVLVRITPDNLRGF